ncbi:MAG: hypothetical protein KKF54_06660 [Candidatus Omnitrophica bacterium]|nr:hypothetical protein [Candidatus Omnitrophota bacterium]
MGRTKIIFLFFIVAITLTGCAQKITYTLKDVPKVSSSIFKNKTLAVKEFQDERTQTSRKGSWYLDKRIVKKDGKNWYCNHEKFYKNKKVAPAITKMLVKHLQHSELFQSVSLDNDGSLETDYVLEGTVSKFEGFKEQNAAAIVGTHFGLLGFLATSAIKSDYEATVMLINVRLLRKGSERSVWEDSIKATIQGEDYADAYGWTAYAKANLALKEAVGKFIRGIQDETNFVQY